MKGIILAGGTGSRLRPLTKVVNKHLLPIAEKPMIYYPIEKLVGADIKEILIVTGIEHIGSVISQLGSGKEFGCNFTYRVQDEAGGIAQALYLAKDFAKNESMAVILGDNLFEDSLKFAVKSWENTKQGAKIFLKTVEDPHRFGVAEIEKDKVTNIIEKPKNPKSNYAVTGIYFYDSSVFSIIEQLKPSARNEYEITDVNNYYLQQGILEYEVFNGWWSDAGTHASIHRSSQLVIKSPPQI